MFPIKLSVKFSASFLAEMLTNIERFTHGSVQIKREMNWRGSVLFVILIN